MDLTSILWVEGVLVEENRATCVMSHAEPTSNYVMIDIFGCFLWRDDTPLACDLLFEGIFFSASAPRVPVVDTEPLLHY